MRARVVIASALIVMNFAAISLAVTWTSSASAQETLRDYVVREDAIDLPLTGSAGDPVRGAALIADRQRGLCLLCHTGPFADRQAHGTLAPDLSDVGARLTEGQLRLRIVDMKQLVPATIMPSYYRTEGLNRVAAAWRDRPVLAAEEIEDIVAFLVQLKG
jgi:L-cysteine S-thiosulfotransferase